jgi:hypothetical protein
MECLHRFCRDCIDKSMRLGYGLLGYLCHLSWCHFSKVLQSKESEILCVI